MLWPKHQNLSFHSSYPMRFFVENWHTHYRELGKKFCRSQSCVLQKSMESLKLSVTLPILYDGSPPASFAPYVS